MDKKILLLNQILLTMLGSTQLVDSWWKSPNKYWDSNTPETIYKTNPREVIDYVLGCCQK